MRISDWSSDVCSSDLVDALAEIETRDNGRAVRESRGDIGMHAQYYHWFASLADKLGGRTIPMDASVHAFTTRHPVGVVGAITPWNVPLMAAAWKLGPALAAGWTVVLKPAESTPASSLALARSEEHTSEIQSLMRTSYAGFCLK